MRIALITPCNLGPDANPGWWMITQGIRNLVRRVVPDAQFLLVDMIEDNHVHWDAAATCTAAILCGNPRFTLSHDSWWEGPIWHRLTQLSETGCRVIDGWSGSAYHASSGRSIAEMATHIRALPRNDQFLQYAAMIRGRITRDPLMQEIYTQAGVEATQLPCSSWWASPCTAGSKQRHAISLLAMRDKPWVAHFIRRVQEELQEEQPVDLLASSWADYLWARGVGLHGVQLVNDPDTLLHLYTTYDKFLAFRIHAAIPAASRGCAVHVVAVDTRATACEAFDLPITAVNDLLDKEITYRQAIVPDVEPVLDTLRRMLV